MRMDAKRMRELGLLLYAGSEIERERKEAGALLIALADYGLEVVDAPILMKRVQPPTAEAWTRYLDEREGKSETP